MFYSVVLFLGLRICVLWLGLRFNRTIKVWLSGFLCSALKEALS